MTTHKAAGFSLPELLITIGIMAIIYSLALPSWRDYIIATRRIDATGALLHLAARQEQFRLQNQRYAGADELMLNPPLGLGLPAIADNRYLLTLITDNNSFTATAAVNPNGSQNDDISCRLFGIDALGRRWSRATDGSDTTAQCWRG